MSRRRHDLCQRRGGRHAHALIERAKGILIEHHLIAEAGAFEMLREHSRTDSRKLIDLAAAIVDGHRMLPRQPRTPIQT